MCEYFVCTHIVHHLSAWPLRKSEEGIRSPRPGAVGHQEGAETKPRSSGRGHFIVGEHVFLYVYMS